MQSEGPYRIRNDREEDVFISGPGLFESGEFPSGNFEYDQICAGLNTAYAEGRKAAEKVLKAGNLAWAWEEAKEALEADGEVGK